MGWPRRGNPAKMQEAALLVTPSIQKHELVEVEQGQRKLLERGGSDELGAALNFAGGRRPVQGEQEGLLDLLIEVRAPLAGDDCGQVAGSGIAELRVEKHQ